MERVNEVKIDEKVGRVMTMNGKRHVAVDVLADT